LGFSPGIFGKTYEFTFLISLFSYLYFGGVTALKLFSVMPKASRINQNCSGSFKAL